MSNSPLTTPAISIPPDFQFGEVDPLISPNNGHLHLEAFKRVLPPPLGPLSHFTGRWIGKGFNTIFRPNNSKTPTPLPSPLPPGDNILELNLTEEHLDFSPSLGSVPNRGTTPQADIRLNGVPYFQTVIDITTGTPGVGIHAEPGLWMLAEPSTDPALGPTLTRMASIPHGTTIQAEGTSLEVNGPPIIKPVDITPFLEHGTQAANPVTFPSQVATNPKTARIPQDLSTFLSAGTITQAMLSDPNEFIRNHVRKANITSTTVLLISTQPNKPLFGGGTDNIAFLLGDPAAAKPNANAVKMEAIFWIETVATTLDVPVFKPGQTAIELTPAPTVPGQPVPTFLVKHNPAKPAAHKLNVTYQQIQYTQTVFLVFAKLNWPHVSVATLVPKDPIHVVA